MERILELYRTQDQFTPEEDLLIEDHIESGELETEDLRIDFKEWVYENHPELPMEEVWDFDEHYSNGLTHKQNLNKLKEFIN